MMEQASGSFIKSLEQLGPFVVVLTLFFLGVLWVVLGLWKEDRAELKRISEARVNDGLATANTMKSFTDALSAHTQAQVLTEKSVQTMNSELARLTTEVARFKQ